MDNWKSTPRDNALLKISFGAPIQDVWPTDARTTESKTSRCGLTMSWQFSVISLQHFLRWKFRNGIKHMFTYLTLQLIMETSHWQLLQTQPHAIAHLSFTRLSFRFRPSCHCKLGIKTWLGGCPNNRQIRFRNVSFLVMLHDVLTCNSFFPFILPTLGTCTSRFTVTLTHESVLQFCF